MAELALTGLLGVAGYALSNNETNAEQNHQSVKREMVDKYTNKTKKVNAELIPKHEAPSVDHVYSSQHFNKALEEEIERHHHNYGKSLKPYENNIIPNNMKRIEAPKTHYSRLAGVEMSHEDFSQSVTVGKGNNFGNQSFKHNNMVPFFGGKITQNVDIKGDNRDILARYTGVGDVGTMRQKKEIGLENFADQFNKNSQMVGGAPNTLNFQQERYETSGSLKVYNNYFPFEQVRVGPGIKKGASNPDGGFQQDAFMNIRREDANRTINQVRTKTNPKINYEGRIIQGKKNTTLRGNIGKVFKNRVETYYEQSPDMYLKAGHSGNQKTKSRPCHDLKPQHRVATQKASIKNQSNISRIVKGLTVPLQDFVRLNRKEYTIMNPRPEGNFQPTSTIPEALPVKDPNDVARTTIKETTIHDTREGFVRGETMDYYELDDTPRVTMRETTEVADQQYGYVGSDVMQKSNAYDNIEIHMKDTDRQIQTHEYTGIGGYAVEGDKSREDMKTAEVNGIREILLKERVPTKTSVKITNGVDFMNVNHKSRLEADQPSKHIFNNIDTPRNQEIFSQDMYPEITVDRDVNTYRELMRIEPEILNAYHRNPYTLTQPIGSVAYSGQEQEAS